MPRQLLWGARSAAHLDIGWRRESRHGLPGKPPRHQVPARTQLARPNGEIDTFFNEVPESISQRQLQLKLRVSLSKSEQYWRDAVAPK